VGLTLAALACRGPHAPHPSPATSDALVASGFAISSFSRGRGVSGGARDILSQLEAIPARDHSRGIPVRWSRERYGLEGETRLCVVYEQMEPAEAALAEIRKIIEGVDLIRLEVGPCELKEEGSPPKF
jgi:hypothetical protein